VFFLQFSDALNTQLFLFLSFHLFLQAPLFLQILVKGFTFFVVSVDSQSRHEALVLV
jgi:hypothetical protein